MAEANAKAEGEQDQSMEEILQSIRRIIAEESDEVKPEQETNGSVQGSDVLELTEIVGGDSAPMNSGDVLSQIDQALAVPAPVAEAPKPEGSLPEPAGQETAHEMAASEPAPQPIAASPAPKPSEETLLSDETAAASSAALRGIAESATRDAFTATQAGPSFRSGMTVEDLAMEALRPMLKQWLDANLPTIVERIVQKEVRRLSSM